MSCDRVQIAYCWSARDHVDKKKSHLTTNRFHNSQATAFRILISLCRAFRSLEGRLGFLSCVFFQLAACSDNDCDVL